MGPKGTPGAMSSSLQSLLILFLLHSHICSQLFIVGGMWKVLSMYLHFLGPKDWGEPISCQV